MLSEITIQPCLDRRGAFRKNVQRVTHYVKTAILP
jgi:hypothetical protein